MVFACRNYNSLYSKDFDSFKDWVDLVNEDYKYCQTIKYLFEFEGKCKDSDLPSYHPYWDFMCKRNLFDLIEGTKGSIHQTEKYIDNGGYYTSNAIGAIIEQKKSIEGYLEKLSNL